MIKKTINVEELKNMVNSRLLHSLDDHKGKREGQIDLIETILMKTGNYNGYNFLDAEKMKGSSNGTTVGIKEQKADGSWNFDDTDHTRIYFY